MHMALVNMFREPHLRTNRRLKVHITQVFPFEPRQLSRRVNNISDLGPIDLMRRENMKLFQHLIVFESLNLIPECVAKVAPNMTAHRVIELKEVNREVNSGPHAPVIETKRVGRKNDNAIVVIQCLEEHLDDGVLALSVGMAFFKEHICVVEKEDSAPISCLF